MLTAEWEQRLTAIAKGEADPGGFLDGIRDMVCDLVKTYSQISEDGQKLFAPGEGSDRPLPPAAESRCMRERRIFPVRTGPVGSSSGRMAASGPPARRS